MEIIILVLLWLWIAGYIVIPGIPVPTFSWFSIRGIPITLREIFIFFVILWLIERAPRPFREISIAAIVLWLLSTFHVISLSGTSNILIFAVIIGLILSLF